MRGDLRRFRGTAWRGVGNRHGLVLTMALKKLAEARMVGSLLAQGLPPQCAHRLPRPRSVSPPAVPMHAESPPKGDAIRTSLDIKASPATAFLFSLPCMPSPHSCGESP